MDLMALNLLVNCLTLAFIVAFIIVSIVLAARDEAKYAAINRRYEDLLDKIIQSLKNTFSDETSKTTQAALNNNNAEDSEKLRQAREKISKAMDIGKQQSELQTKLRAPSMNALHSKYKNEIATEIFKLEQQKLTLLKQAINDVPGIDFVMKVIDGKSDIKTMSLSQYIAESEKVLQDLGMEVVSNPPVDATSDVSVTNTSTDDSTQVKKVGKFIVYNGGKGSSATDGNNGGH